MIGAKRQVGWINWQRPVAAPTFLAQDLEKQSNCLPLLGEMVLLELATFSDPSPAAYQTCLPEEVTRDLHLVVARHVAVRIKTFTIDFIRLCDHGVMISGMVDDVQREF